MITVIQSLAQVGGSVQKEGEKCKEIKVQGQIQLQYDVYSFINNFLEQHVLQKYT